MSERWDRMFQEITDAVVAFEKKGGYVVIGGWGDGVTCGCPMVCLARARGALVDEQGPEFEDINARLFAKAFDNPTQQARRKGDEESMSPALGRRVRAWFDERHPPETKKRSTKHE